MSEFSSGFIGLIGRPNVGKSTLLNRLIGQKVAIVSDKPQTTRTRMRGVLTRPGVQAVLVDTPGIHRPLHLLGEYMVNEAKSTIPDVDVVLFVVDGSEQPWSMDRQIASDIRTAGVPTVLAVNKADLIPPENLSRRVAAYESLGSFDRTLPVSAQTGLHMEELFEALVSFLPEGPQLYPDEWVSDHPEQFLMAEFIREQVLHRTREEVPHAVAVEIEEVQVQENGVTAVRATLYVERDSQKGILIGNGGQMLKEIGRGARHEIEALLGTPVFLQLWVKVKKDWRERPGSLRQFGFE